ncbi:MAG: polysaccharide pyruvyl transferase family protein, partial [Clostridia bacterium]|nr:polysaccharide pyruvyl transferase family protein [Clostridia bacterium]
MKKKLGIVTITALENFGNRLQNYALQEVLKNLGFEVETIPNHTVYRYRQSPFFTLAKKAASILTHSPKHISELRRKQAFDAFNKKYIKFSRCYSTNKYIPKKLNDNYDFFIAGSDQIWNPYYNFNFDLNFLAFADKSKRVAYSASFSVDEIPREKVSDFNQYLSAIDNISVREYEGAKIIEELTDKKAPVTLDPTLLIDAEDWRKIAVKPSFISNNEQFIFVYYLGKRDDLEKLKDNVIKEHPEWKSCRIIDIGLTDNTEIYSVSPDNFLWLTDNASAVITDSYHGTIFSLIFNTPFVSMLTKGDSFSMDSRIKTLFKTLDLNVDCG